MKFLVHFSLAALVFASVACSSQKSETETKHAPTDMGQIKEETLEVRSDKTQSADNYVAATLYLTQFDKKQNHGILTVSTNYRVAQNPVTNMSETCSEKTDCGFLKLDSNIELKDIDQSSADQKIKSLGVKSNYDMPNDGDFNQGDTWLLKTNTIEYAGGPLWTVVIAMKLVDFKPHTNKVTIQYKVLQYRK